MKANNETSRREFLAASSSLVLAGSLAVLDEKNTTPAADSRLALLGGPKAVSEPMPRLVRWGEPERERLNTMIGRDSIFYWKGPQTALLIERFRAILSLKPV